MRVGDPGIPIHPRLAPLIPGLAGKANLAGAGVPVNIVIKRDILLLPIAGKEIATIPVNDVPLESEAQMILDARPLDLRIAAEREDVVTDDVLLAVVLVKPAVRGAM